MLIKLISIIITLLPFYSKAFELQVIKGISKTGKTFITRTGKKDGVFVGKQATFTADNISLIAKAITVNREFTQWEVENNYSEVPFRNGQIVTYYNTTEYLWALAPNQVKRKFIKNDFYRPRKSYSIHTSFFRGISESVSGVETQSESRGGVQVEGFFENEFNLNFAIAFGLRFSSETVNVQEASLNSQRFLGVLEARYYFDPIGSFYNARPLIALGTAFGQSSTKASGLSSSGTATILPITKLGLSLPLSKQTEFSFEVAFESIETNEEFEGGDRQIANVDNFKTGISVKRFF